MWEPSERSWRLPRVRSHPFDGHHPRDLLKPSHDALQLREIRAKEREDVRRAPVVARATRCLADVDPLLVERLTDRREDAEPVLCRDLHLDRPIDLGAGV